MPLHTVENQLGRPLFQKLSKAQKAATGSTIPCGGRVCAASACVYGCVAPPYRVRSTHAYRTRIEASTDRSSLNPLGFTRPPVMTIFRVFPCCSSLSAAKSNRQRVSGHRHIQLAREPMRNVAVICRRIPFRGLVTNQHGHKWVTCSCGEDQNDSRRSCGVLARET